MIRSNRPFSSLFCLFSPLLVLVTGCPSPAVTPAPVAVVQPVVRQPVAAKEPAATPIAPADLPEEVTREGGFAQLTFAQALTLSTRDSKPLLLYFYTPWCGPCKELDKKTFPDAAFQKMAGELVSIKVNAGEESHIPVAKHFGVHSYPTMIVCRPGGEEIERFFGFQAAPVFIATVQDYLAGRNTASDYRDRALADPNNLDLAFTAGRELAIRKRGNEAIPFLERVWRAGDAEASDNVPRAMLLHAKTVYLDQQNDQARALPILEALSSRYPTTYHGVEATYMIARIYVETKEMDKAREVLMNRVKIAPHDGIQYFRFGSFCLRYRVFLDEGISRVLEGLEQHPKEGYLWKLLADLRFRTHDYAGAVAAMEKAVEFTRTGKDTYQKLLETYRRALARQNEAK
jgi:tetratricopeptide (TPR) repeat protein